MVSFNQIPGGIRTPLVAVEIDATRAQAQTAARPFRVLVLGQKTDAAGGATLVPTRFTRVEEVAAAFGAGSMLHGMARATFAQSVAIEANFLAIADPTGGAKASATVQFAALSPLAGQVVVYVGGRRYSIATSSASTAETLALALTSEINADPSAYVTAAAATDTVTLTAKNAGAAAGLLDLRQNYQVGEQTPSGIIVTLTPFSGGSGDVDMAAIVAALPDEKWDAIAVPYTDAASLAALEGELADRFGPMRDIAGVAFTASSAAYGGVASLGNGRNSPHVSVLSSFASPSPEWEWAAAAAMTVAVSAFADPARPLQTLVLKGILPPEEVDRFTQPERNLLLFDGVSTTRANPAGEVALERAITTYKQTSSGAADTAYLDVETLFVLDRLRYDVRETFARKFPRFKLADDGTRAGPGSNIVTPSSARAELLSIARGWEAAGLVEDVDAFKDQIQVERSSTEVDRLNLFIPPDIVNGLRVVAAQLGFTL
ncbi:MAG: phage tail sheath subtilisin-like domain-containing protein [Planctomycetota bacterium]